MPFTAQERTEGITHTRAIKEFFEMLPSEAMKEIKELTKEERNDLGGLCLGALGMKLKPPVKSKS